MAALATIARGTLRLGSIVSPTWQAAASNAGAAKPIMYSPAMNPVSSPNHPSNATVRWNELACRQSTLPATTGASAETSARSADAVAIGMVSRPAHLTPHRLTAAKPTTREQARAVVGIDGRYHSWIAAAEKIAVNPH